MRLKAESRKKADSCACRSTRRVVLVETLGLFLSFSLLSSSRSLFSYHCHPRCFRLPAWLCSLVRSFARSFLGSLTACLLASLSPRFTVPGPGFRVSRRTPAVPVLSCILPQEFPSQFSAIPKSPNSKSPKFQSPKVQNSKVQNPKAVPRTHKKRKDPPPPKLYVLEYCTSTLSTCLMFAQCARMVQSYNRTTEHVREDSGRRGRREM